MERIAGQGVQRFIVHQNRLAILIRFSVFGDRGSAAERGQIVNQPVVRISGSHPCHVRLPFADAAVRWRAGTGVSLAGG